MVERWPIDEAVPLLLEHENSSLLRPPTQIVQPMRDIARRFLSDTVPPPLDSIKSLQILLERNAPDDPFILLLLLSALHCLPAHIKTSDRQAAIKSVSDKISRCIKAEGKWTFFPAGEPEEVEQDWGLRKLPRRRVKGGDGALEFGQIEAKATVKALDGLVEKARGGEVETEVLRWYATQPTLPSTSPRIHRTRLFNYLEPLVTSDSTPNGPSSLPLPLLNIFLYPALLHQGSDPLVTLFALQALLLASASPSASEPEREAAKEAMKTLLAKLDRFADSWTSEEHHQLQKLPKTEGKRIREAFGVQCLKRLVDSGLLFEDQKGMWDKVFGIRKEEDGKEAVMKAMKAFKVSA